MSPANQPAPATEEQLDEYLSRPPAWLVESLAAVPGDLLVLGAAGKMGPSLSMMARRAFVAGDGGRRRVIAVSRFHDPLSMEALQRSGIETIQADLLADGALDVLPDAPNVLFLAGMKFGSSGDLPATWAMNTFLPGLVARRFAGSRIVALSTGNVYPLVSPTSGGSKETDPVGPVGEYALSCLGRERLMTYESEQRGTPLALIRLNYANALRYGVVIDIARKVLVGDAIDVTTGYVNVIWQGDSNAAILGAFGAAASPPLVLNVAGPEIAPVRELAKYLSTKLGVSYLRFTGAEAETALLSDGSRARERFAEPSMPLELLLDWSAAWLRQGGALLNKPTGFQARDGRF